MSMHMTQPACQLSGATPEREMANQVRSPGVWLMIQIVSRQMEVKKPYNVTITQMMSTSDPVLAVTCDRKRAGLKSASQWRAQRWVNG
jgi:hypothetical protein